MFISIIVRIIKLLFFVSCRFNVPIINSLCLWNLKGSSECESFVDAVKRTTQWQSGSFLRIVIKSCKNAIEITVANFLTILFVSVLFKLWYAVYFMLQN